MLSFATDSLIFLSFEIILVMGLNVQYGLTGILNLAYIVTYAAGAYITGVVSGPPAAGSVTHIGGYNLPWYVGILAGLVAAYIVSAIIGAFTLGRRLRASFMTVGTLVIAAVVLQVISSDIGLLNGQLGLIQIPPPVGDSASYGTPQRVFLLIAMGMAVASFILCEMLLKAPFGRMLRAIRDDEVATEVFGYAVFRMKMKSFIFGSIFSALAGSLTILYIGAFSPAGWAVYEVIFALTCLFVGGVGNNRGGVLGATLVVLIIDQASLLVPTVQEYPTLVQSIRTGLVGVLLILILRFRPQGLIPERPQPLQLGAEPRRWGVRAPRLKVGSNVTGSGEEAS